MQENETAEASAADETTATATETNAPDISAESQTEESSEAGPVSTDKADGDEITAETAAAVPETPAEPEEEEEVTYHAVQKEDSVTAIWEMQGRKHIRTIDPRSREGAEILRLFTAEEGEEAA